MAIPREALESAALELSGSHFLLKRADLDATVVSLVGSLGLADARSCFLRLDRSGGMGVEAEVSWGHSKVLPWSRARQSRARQSHLTSQFLDAPRHSMRERPSGPFGALECQTQVTSPGSSTRSGVTANQPSGFPRFDMRSENVIHSGA